MAAPVDKSKQRHAVCLFKDPQTHLIPDRAAVDHGIIGSRVHDDTTVGKDAATVVVQAGKRDGGGS